MLSRRTVLGAVGGMIAVAGSAMAGVVVSMPSAVDGPGSMLAEFQGHTETSGHADASDAPRELVPEWTRAVGHDVTVVRPGDASGDDSGSRRADMTWEGTLPDCTELPRTGMPFDGGGNWPDLAGEPAELCQGWVTVVLDGHLYAWTDDALLAGA